jgi:hypothetical protein
MESVALSAVGAALQCDDSNGSSCTGRDDGRSGESDIASAAQQHDNVGGNSSAVARRNNRDGSVAAAKSG